MLPVHRGTVRLLQQSPVEHTASLGTQHRKPPHCLSLGRQNLSTARNPFHPFLSHFKTSGNHPAVTAADSEGSHNVFLWITAWEEILFLAAQHSRAVWEKLKKFGRQEIKNTTSLSSTLGSVRNLLFLQNCSIQCLDTTTNGRPNNPAMIPTAQVMYVIQHS